MPTRDFSPTPLDHLIFYVFKATDRVFGSIELAKVIYLIDIEKARFLGGTVTGEEYSRAERGPLVRGFGDSITRMSEYEVKVEKKAPLGLNRWGKHCHSLGPNPRFEPTLSEADRVIADRVLRRTAGLSPRQLEHLAYQTEPMQAIVAQEKRGEELWGGILDFSLVKQDPDITAWQANRRKHKLQPDYLRFLEQERREVRDLVKLLD